MGKELGIEGSGRARSPGPFELKDLAGPTGTIGLTPNEKRVAEDRRFVFERATEKVGSAARFPRQRQEGRDQEMPGLSRSLPPRAEDRAMSSRDAIVALDRVEFLILSIRGRRVILDSDLARLYGATTSRLNEQVKRNPDRFPPDFMFRLSRQEVTALISQNATSRGRGGRRELPYVFTEHGAIMAANPENSPDAERGDACGSERG
jgi:hypothetical protein